MFGNRHAAQRMSERQNNAFNDELVKAIRNNDVEFLAERLAVMPRERYVGSSFSIESQKTELLPLRNIALMHLAALYDALDCFLYLETLDLKYNQESAASYHPIHYACWNGSYEVVSYILEKDPSEAKVLPSVDNHLIYLATLSGDAEILEMLLKNGADVSADQNVKNQPVNAAIKSRHVACLKLLLKYKPRRTRDHREFSSLMLAISNCEAAAVPILIECGEDPSYIAPNVYESALSLACFQGEEWIHIVKLICEKAETLDLPPDVKEKGAIHWACSSKSPEIVRMVLERGVDVNRLDKNGYTGAHYMVDACSEDKAIEILEVMMEYGFTLTGPNLSIVVDFVTAIKKQFRVIEWLFAHGVDPNEKYDNKKIADYVLASSRTNMKMRKIHQQWCKK